MRFTTPEEAGDPDTDFVSRIVDRMLIVVEKSGKMAAQLSCDDIFFKLLLDAALVLLGNFDDAVNWTVNLFPKYIMNKHLTASSQKIKRAVVMAI